ncbi:MAG: hypothetical protein QXT47_03535 [Desulfurococcaceae archaeon]
MILISNGLTKLVPLMKGLDEIIVITTRMFKTTEAKLILIEDTGTRESIPFKFQSIKYTYELASTYMYKISIPQDNFVFLIDSTNGLDIGFAIRILEELASNTTKLPNTTLIIRAPDLDSDEIVKARFYGFIKTIFLYDIFLNSIRPTCFKYVFIDSSAAFPAFRRTVEILSRVKAERSYSLVHVRMKRFIVPVSESLLLAKILRETGELKELAEEYAYIVASLNLLLDKAPTDLWYIARKSVDKFRVSYRSYRLSREGLDKAIEMIGKLLKTVIDGGRYTKLLFDFKKFFEAVTIGGGLSSVIQSDDFIESVNDAVNVESTAIPDLYSRVKIDHYEDYSRIILASRDLSSCIKSGLTGLIDDAVGELLVAETYGIPVDHYGYINRDYFPQVLVDAYINRAGLSLDYIHPRRLRIGSTEVESSKIYTLHPVNYRGLMRAVEEKRGDKYRFLEEILGIRFI